MKAKTFALLAVLFCGSAAYGHDHGESFGLGDLGGLGLGGLGFGDDHHGRGFGDGFGFGFGFFDVADVVDNVQGRFADRLDTLQTQYDNGVADNTDFFTTSLYDRIVNRTERLSDQYGLFLSGVQHGIDRIGDVITTYSDDLTYYNDLLTNYQADDTISAARLARIEAYINRITDRLTTKIDNLTETQTTLQTNLPTYQSFQTDISTFLTDIQNAGSGTDTTTTTSGLKSLVAAATMTASTSSGSLAACDSLPLSSGGAVPEPSIVGLLLCAGGMTLLRRESR
ncbi:MAG: PEP-CTERM sorting domain-containing protein [Pirellulales bacterium]